MAFQDNILLFENARFVNLVEIFSVMFTMSSHNFEKKLLFEALPLKREVSNGIFNKQSGDS